MAKPLKIMLALFGGLLLLLLAAVIALSLLFNPNDFRADLAEAVKNETGRDFAVADIRLSVFPWLKLELRELTLGNAPGFGEAPMLVVQRAEVGVKLLPLLREKRVQASTITLDGAVIQLVINTEGLNNWQDLLKSDKAKADSRGDKAGTGLKDLDIEGLSLSNVRMGYDDQRSGQQLQIDALQLKTGRLHGADPFVAEGSFTVERSQPKASAKVGFAAEIAYDAVRGDVRLKSPHFTLDAQQVGAQPLSAVLALQGETLGYAKATQILSASPLTLSIESLAIGAADKPLLTAKGTFKTQLVADLAQRLHQLAGLDAELQLGGSSMPGGKPQAVKLAGSIAADLAAQQVKISTLTLAGLGLKASASEWLLSGISGESPTLAGDLSLAPFDPRALMAALGIAVPVMADAGALKSASLKTQLTANAKRVALDALALQLDDTSLSGTLAVTDLASKAIRFDLRADRLDADRYLPPPLPKAGGDEAAKPAAKADLNATPLPFEMLQKLNAQGALQVASLKLKNVQMADVRLALDGAAGATKRQQLQANLYGGSAKLALKLAPGAPQGIELSLASINVGALLKDFAESDKLSGKGSITFDVTTRGATVGEARQSLNGTLAFNLADGAVKGFNLGKIIRDGQALLSVQPPAAATGEMQATDFAELRGAGVFVNGVLKSDQLSAKNPLIRLEGSGEVDLVNETLNYLAKPTLVNTASGQGGKERVDLSGIVIPIRLTGALSHPKVAIDWQTALQQQAAGQLREKLGVSEETVREQREALRDKAKTELNKAVGEDVGKALQNLFNRKKPEPAPAPPPAPEVPASGGS